MLPDGDLPDGPVEAILAWCAGDRERLEAAYSAEMKHDARVDVERALGGALFRLGFWGEQAPERAS